MSEFPDLWRLTNAIAAAERRLGDQRHRVDEEQSEPAAIESARALDLMRLQLTRLKRHCLAAARRTGTMH